MEQQKNFALNFLNKEAECWTKSELNDIEDFNQSVKQIYSLGTNDMDEAFGIFEEDELDNEENPTKYKPGYLFKLSLYRNEIYGNIWVAYTSYKNPRNEPHKSGINRAFIISLIDSHLKVIGLMSVALSESEMKPVGWSKSIYNPSNLDINNLGEFVTTERYNEPFDDGFSLQDYLANK